VAHVTVDSHFRHKPLLGKHPHLGLPRLWDKLWAVNSALHLFPFKVFRKAVQARGSSLDGADDVLGENFGKVMEQSGELVVRAALGTSVDLE
jgi:hypothetical protein